MISECIKVQNSNTFKTIKVVVMDSCVSLKLDIPEPGIFHRKVKVGTCIENALKFKLLIMEAGVLNEPLSFIRLDDFIGKLLGT
jgi:hypothetical protein